MGWDLSPRGIFGDHFVFALAQQQANGGIVLRVFYLAVYGSQIKTQLAQVFGLEFAALEFDHDIATQLEMVEQQVDEKLVSAHAAAPAGPRRRSLRPAPAGIP